LKRSPLGVGPVWRQARQQGEQLGILMVIC